MSVAISEQILAGIFTRLGVLMGDYQAVGLYRDRGYDVPLSALPALSLDDGGDSSADDTAIFGVTLKTREIVVQLRVQADDDNGIAPAMSDLYLRVASTVLADDQQGALAITTHDGGLSPLEKPDNPNLPNLGAAEARFSIQYQHVTGRPDLLG